MEFFIFFTIIVFGLGAFIIYRSTSKKRTAENYYYRRYLRNRVQLEKHIDSLQQLILNYECGSHVWDEGKNSTVEAYLLQLKINLQNEYSEGTLKLLKRNKLKNKDKKYYSKILIKQSEMLFRTETDLIILHNKYSVLAVL